MHERLLPILHDSLRVYKSLAEFHASRFLRRFIRFRDDRRLATSLLRLPSTGMCTFAAYEKGAHFYKRRRRRRRRRTAVISTATALFASL